MKTTVEYDYIIVGQGLAGSCLAMQLLDQQKKILVIDQIQEHTASRISAGLFNPITGRNMIKTWMADRLYPYLHDFYKTCELRTSKSFFYPMPLYRPFVSIEEQNEWMGKSSDDSYSAYVDVIHTSPIDQQIVKNEFGGLMLKQCGYLDTIKFMSAVRQYIKDTASLLEDSFVETDLILETNLVRYRGCSAKKIIFCQGEQALSSALFSWLPIRPLKGETLTIKTTQQFLTIYNRGVYVVPGIWRVGATYQFQDSTRTITQHGLQELTEKLNDLISFPYAIVNQSWGMRPSTVDRRPILGSHPNHKSVAIFNGLGTKGVSLAPYFSHVLAEWLEKGTPINKEVDIQRYKHYYYDGNLLR